jgi:hypothetical protein
MVRATRKSGKAIDVFSVAFHRGDPIGFMASVIDGRLATSKMPLPLCFMDEQGMKSEECVRHIVP